jgi:hypothetical protein
VPDDAGGKQPHPFYPDRWADGTVRPENQTARKHGVDSAAVRRGEVPHELRQSVDEFRAGVISDQGGRTALTTLQAAYIVRLTEIDVCCRMLENDLVRRGLHTKGGRVRSSYDKFLATIALWDRIAQRVGVDRLAKPVTSLQEFLNQRVEHSTAPTPDVDPNTHRDTP